MSKKIISLLVTLVAGINVWSQVHSRPVNRPSANLGVVYGQTDSCDLGKVEAIIRDNTDCRTLNTNRSWSIKIGQTCRDISDTTVQSACVAIQTENAPEVIFGQTDSCDISKVVAPINMWTDCREFAGQRSWSVKINGICKDISDTTGEMACRAIQATNAPLVIFGQTDSCDMTKVEAVIDEDTDCNQLSTTNRSWSVKVNGVCRDISDTVVRNACVGIQAQDARNVIFGQTDSCDSSKVVSIINRRTRCDLLPNERSWSIKQNGVCKDISDTDAPSACRAIQFSSAPNVVFGQTDSCDMTKAVVAVNNRTDCRSLKDAQQRSWSIKINGVCRDISDTTVGQACLGIQSEAP